MLEVDDIFLSSVLDVWQLRLDFRSMANQWKGTLWDTFAHIERRAFAFRS